jgi:hypothetical protein
LPCSRPPEGDPLSPFLFLLVIEVLSALVQRVDAWALPQSLGAPRILHRASFYADDVIMFIKPAVQDIQTIKVIFDVFLGASGLGCNLAESQYAPI